MWVVVCEVIGSVREGEEFHRPEKYYGCSRWDSSGLVDEEKGEEQKKEADVVVVAVDVAIVETFYSVVLANDRVWFPPTRFGWLSGWQCRPIQWGRKSFYCCYCCCCYWYYWYYHYWDY